jgi:hypothetical protein
MMRLISLAASMLLATAPVWAEPYWYAYEGNDFPEDEGWVRYASDPPAERWLEDGSLFIDSRADVDITDSYGIIFADGGLNPEPAEVFLMSWALLVEESHLWDPGISVRSDDQWDVILLFDEGSLLSVYEPDIYVEFEPGGLHEFELRSSDMRGYELFVDGDLAVEGVFFESLFSGAHAGFGDLARGGASLAAWDYFRFGVIPEPTTWLMTVMPALLLRPRRCCAPRTKRARD